VKRAKRLGSRSPHQQPGFIAIARTAEGKRKYFQCRTYEQALAHKPYLVEHVNGFGQVTRRDRVLAMKPIGAAIDQALEREARA
jgi:hypothetical protein